MVRFVSAKRPRASSGCCGCRSLGSTANRSPLAARAESSSRAMSMTSGMLPVTKRTCSSKTHVLKATSLPGVTQVPRTVASSGLERIQEQTAAGSISWLRRHALKVALPSKACAQSSRRIFQAVPAQLAAASQRATVTIILPLAGGITCPLRYQQSMLSGVICVPKIFSPLLSTQCVVC